MVGIGILRRCCRSLGRPAQSRHHSYSVRRFADQCVSGRLLISPRGSLRQDPHLAPQSDWLGPAWPRETCSFRVVDAACDLVGPNYANIQCHNASCDHPGCRQVLAAGPGRSPSRSPCHRHRIVLSCAVSLFRIERALGDFVPALCVPATTERTPRQTLQAFWRIEGLLPKKTG